MKHLERRIERLERQRRLYNGDGIALINEGDPIPEGAEIVIVDDIKHVFIDDIAGARRI